MGLRPLFEDWPPPRDARLRRVRARAVRRAGRTPSGPTADRARMGASKELDDDAAARRPRARAADWLVRARRRRARSRSSASAWAGMYALKAAATDRFDAAVAFYGMIRVPERWTGRARDRRSTRGRACARRSRSSGATIPGRPRPTSTRCAGVGGRADCEIVVYEGAEHGFVHDPDRPAHRADDAADAWRRASLPRLHRVAASCRRASLDGLGFARSSASRSRMW